MKKGAMLIFVVFVILISFFVVGVGMRVSGKLSDIDYRLFLRELDNPERLPEGLFINDPVIGYALNPGFETLAVTSDFNVIYKINSKGQRDQEYPYDRPPGKKRVLAFGDSFTFGEGVKYGERFTDIPETNEIEIINFGVPGYGLDQSLALYKIEGSRYEHDMVIIFLNAVSLGRISYEVNMTATRGQKTVYSNPGERVFNSSNFMFKDSYFLSYLRYLYLTTIREKGFKEFDRKEGVNLSKKIVSSAEVAKTFENKTLNVLTEFIKTAKNQDADIIIINIDKNYNLTFVSKMYVSYYPLTEKLQSLNFSLRFEYDPHYNKATHEFIGKETVSILRNVYN